MRTLARAGLAAAAFAAVGGVVLRISGLWARIVAQGKAPSGRLGRIMAWTFVPFVGILHPSYAQALALQPEDEVLDVACGSGVFLKKHASHVRRIAGLDHSELMIEEALKQNRERVAAGTAEFVVGDVTALPWPDGSFSVVTSNDVDCYLEKARTALEEMCRVLRPGGRALVQGDRRGMMEAAGFTQVSTRRVLLGYDTMTSGFKA